MDLEEIKKLLANDTKIIIIEDNKPIMMITALDYESNQGKLNLEEKPLEEKPLEEKPIEMSGAEEDISQSTEVIAKEEMPVDELRVEDLPFE